MRTVYYNGNQFFVGAGHRGQVIQWQGAVAPENFGESYGSRWKIQY